MSLGPTYSAEKHLQQTLNERRAEAQQTHLARQAAKTEAGATELTRKSAPRTVRLPALASWVARLLLRPSLAGPAEDC